MSQIIVDEQLGRTEVLLPLRRWITARKIESFRPFEVIKDDRVLQILWELKRPTFVTIDSKFYDKGEIIMANQMANRKMTLIADISDGIIKIPIELQKHFPPFGKCQMEVENDKIIIRNIQKNEDEIVAETIQKALKLLYTKYADSVSSERLFQLLETLWNWSKMYNESFRQVVLLMKNAVGNIIPDNLAERQCEALRKVLHSLQTGSVQTQEDAIACNQLLRKSGLSTFPLVADKSELKKILLEMLQNV